MTIKYSDFKPFEDAVKKITDNFDFIKAHYLAARKDEVRQEIIDGINNGTIKTKNDVRAITIKQAPTYNYMIENDLLPDFMKEINV
ncbi:MAG: hypothetical protein K6A44_01655 [bacterium]|nr:hypothetical protein [bacterium]